MLKVIISNGHFKFILGAIAAELHKRDMLKLFITAGYPSPFITACCRIFRIKSKAAGCLLERREDLPFSMVKPIWSSEWLQKIGTAICSRNHDKMHEWAMNVYSWFATKLINATEANIYHYRSGYGHQSVVAAKKKGMITICDHSIAHPRVLYYLIEHQGKLPTPSHRPEISEFWTRVEDDINQADFVIVNSDFVKTTFINRGWDDWRVFVAYTGLDRELMNDKPAKKRNLKNSSFIQFQFAGEGGARKGLPEVLRAFQSIDNFSWRLKIIGNIHSYVFREFGDFLRDERIEVIPFCSRQDLLDEMGKSDVFVFPSLAEGSARVVFMAMAMGCYIITTHNAGSVVVDRVNGAIVEPGDVVGLAGAICDCYSKLDILQEIGTLNQKIMKTKYTQSNYGSCVIEIYELLMKKKIS